MKNLEEEIEVEDENDYLPPKPLTKINIKTKDNNYKYNINRNTQPKDEKKNKTNYIINIKRVDKTKNIKDNKERHTIREYKKIIFLIIKIILQKLLIITTLNLHIRKILIK